MIFSVFFFISENFNIYTYQGVFTYVWRRVCVSMCEAVSACVRLRVIFEKWRNNDDNARKEKESVTSLCLDFTQHSLYIYD